MIPQIDKFQARQTLPYPRVRLEGGLFGNEIARAATWGGRSRPVLHCTNELINLLSKTRYDVPTKDDHKQSTGQTNEIIPSWKYLP
jgi:hypothetical protein